MTMNQRLCTEGVAEASLRASPQRCEQAGAGRIGRFGERSKYEPDQSAPT